jgi:hypothetical protein
VREIASPTPSIGNCKGAINGRNVPAKAGFDPKFQMITARHARFLSSISAARQATPGKNHFLGYTHRTGDGCPAFKHATELGPLQNFTPTLVYTNPRMKMI